MSNNEFYGVWEKEAEAALGAVEAGAIKHIFKVAGKHEVIAVCDFPDGDIWTKPSGPPDLSAGLLARRDRRRVAATAAV
jgi:hypothetical protein